MEEMICSVYTVFCYAQHTQVVQTYIDCGKERMIKMIELTNVAYWTLVALSAIGGYILHGVVDAIKKGEFFDQEETEWKI